jgi:hypothetical protein
LGHTPFALSVDSIPFLAWGRLFKSAWRDFNPTLDFIQSKIELGMNLIEAERRSLGPEVVQAVTSTPEFDLLALAREATRYKDRRNDLAQGHETSEKSRKEKENSEVLGWLAAAAINEVSHVGFCKKKENHPGTGRRILSNDKVEIWISLEDTPPSHSLLWIHPKKVSVRISLIMQASSTD